MIVPMTKVHPLLDGIDAIGARSNGLPDRHGLFAQVFGRIRSNWISNRAEERWPSQSNWVLRTAPEFTQHPTKYLEKQLQKNIAILLQDEGWGNDVPTASGLVNDRGRQMNIDLAHQIPDGFEFIELKLESNTPYEAALQILRYGAVYLLYRLEPELARRFRGNRMMNAKRIVLEILAPMRYYTFEDVDLPLLEAQLDRQVAKFAEEHAAGLSLSFRFMAFHTGFVFRPGMSGDLIREAVRSRRSPFRKPGRAGSQIAG
jgi:hypothetical protein